MALYMLLDADKKPGRSHLSPGTSFLVSHQVCEEGCVSVDSIHSSALHKFGGVPPVLCHG